jgi:TrmH family RNA methyltransferase
VQRLRRLLARRSARDGERCFVVEGANVLVECVRAGVAVESTYLDPGAPEPVRALAARCQAAGARSFELELGVIERISDTVHPQPVLAVVSYLDRPLADLLVEPSTAPATDAALVMVCVDVRDPGNAGTVLRSAEGAGATGVVCCDGGVDAYNPKTVRASAGALFHVPLVARGGPLDVLEQLGAWGLRRWGTTARGGLDYTEADLTEPIAVVLGNESHGLPEEVTAGLDGSLSIPMRGRSESLNVGMAAAVIGFEAARQRRAVTPRQSGSDEILGRGSGGNGTLMADSAGTRRTRGQPASGRGGSSSA